MFSNKDPSEIVVLTFDFTNILAAPLTPAIAVTVVNGADGAPSALLSGVPSIVGSTVTQKVTGGLSGVSYKIACTVNGADGSKYVLADILPVISV